MQWVVKKFGTFYIINVELKFNTNMHVRTHLVRDCLTCSIFRIYVMELSITIANMCCGIQKEADHWQAGWKGWGLGKVIQSSTQETYTSWIRASWFNKTNLVLASSKGTHDAYCFIGSCWTVQLVGLIQVTRGFHSIVILNTTCDKKNLFFI